ncbi:killer toxin sensitivity protein [Cordyceps fumosorosea ARSEF 2679]|uniref:Elongator complex protein 5 n=1 Tax=Cordyceps fumosorosea (strain ARSEF 2679) TaxID=1081104 RepID=A0A168DCE7_CORFA|nr:killer toxin sensitivity protein [Cordyceps fumosorosea ARSEF 2679]OAA72433.1 killer toxin sensitivity protein [Cordyceps fumosorosea ARSEF 2679]
MAPTNAAHTRSHSLLLLQKLLNLRDGASPFTLLLDNLEQPATSVVSEFITRAKLSKTKVIFLSFATIKKPRDVDVVVKATGKHFNTIRKEILSHYPPVDPSAAAARDRNMSRKNAPPLTAYQPPPSNTLFTTGAVVIIDSLNTLASSIPLALATFLSSVITPAVSIVGVYHTDVPVLPPPTQPPRSDYEPAPLTVLCHLATAILRLSSLAQEAARQRARDKALVEPEWGIDEGREGVLVGLRSGAEEEGGVVVAMELRRRSGRTVTETFVLMREGRGTGALMLRGDHPVFAAPVAEAEGVEGETGPESTFDLGLTEKQRRDREGIVLPYFDAQTEVGGGDGGRILYEMGREDDFDEEEDEI